MDPGDLVQDPGKNNFWENLEVPTYPKTNSPGTMVSLTELKNWFLDHFMGSPGAPLGPTPNLTWPDSSPISYT